MDPAKNSSIIIGDFNFSDRKDKHFVVSTAANIGEPSTVSQPPPEHYSTQFHTWSDILKSWTEISQPFPTHFNSSGPSLRRLDRVWSSSPSHLLSKLHVHSEVISSPENLSAEGFSDHAPLALVFGKKQFHNSRVQPINKLVCSHFYFPTN